MSTNQLTSTWMQVGGVALDGTSMAASITSDQVLTAFEDNVGIQVKWTGTPTGTITVQRSMDPTNLGWDTIVFNPTLTQPTGSASGTWVEVLQTTAGFIRLVYTRASGTGALFAKIAAKSV